MVLYAVRLYSIHNYHAVNRFVVRGYEQNKMLYEAEERQNVNYNEFVKHADVFCIPAV